MDTNLATLVIFFLLIVLSVLIPTVFPGCQLSPRVRWDRQNGVALEAGFMYAVQAKHRSGYDLDRVREVGGWGIQNKSRFINNEKEFDRLSIIKPGETLEQWKARVMEEVKILISRKSHSIYHRFCLHASSGDVESDASYSDYKRPETHSSRAVICFKCWEIFRPNDETCGRTAKDLMQEHWENECGRIRINYCDPLVLKNFFNSMHNDGLRRRRQVQ
ncbi:22101_t:CDS:2 [Rhizophagus irregularis]|nr:22101_t:CDS:2 [Rhizophagus irregularis]